jgi:hypothetical protein
MEPMPRQSIGKILEDVQLILGLSQQEIVNLLSVLDKADFGSLDFFRGKTYIKFQKIMPEGKHSRITLKVNIDEGSGESNNEFTVPRAFLHSAKNQNKLRKREV